MGEMRNVCKILVEKPEGKRILGRTRRCLEYNVKIDLKEIGYEIVDWIQVAQTGFRGGLCEDGNETSGPKKGEEFVEQLSEYQLLK
jgi:hypothetical protein